MICNECKYYDKNKKICIDKENFVDKKDIKRIVCRYNKQAIPFREAYVDQNKK